MVTIRAVSLLIITLPMARGLVLCAEPTNEDDAAEATVIDFGQLSDPQLAERLEQMLSEDGFRRNANYEACLNELVRRGTGQSAAILRKRFNVLMHQTFKQYEGQEIPHPGSFFNLELLTALRRSQKQLDPLHIFVESHGRPITAKTLSLPSIKVTIKNVDVEKQEVGFTDGGDYRSGRQARWRLQVVDENGSVVSSRPQHGLIIGGGQFVETVLKYGESWETVLDLRNFISTPPPGRYQLQVFYHNTKTIADEDDLSRLIVSKSATIPLIIEPSVIFLSDEDVRKARNLIANIPQAEKLKIVVGSYGPWAHDFVAPDSPQGKLLEMGLKAVPPLIEALRHDDLPLHKQTFILSVLFSITGENDPRNCSALGEYDYLEGPWAVFGGQPGGPKSGGFGFPSKGSSWMEGAIDPKALHQLAATWTEWVTSAP